MQPPLAPWPMARHSLVSPHSVKRTGPTRTLSRPPPIRTSHSCPCQKQLKRGSKMRPSVAAHGPWDWRLPPTPSCRHRPREARVSLTERARVLGMGRVHAGQGWLHLKGQSRDHFSPWIWSQATALPRMLPRAQAPQVPTAQRLLNTSHRRRRHPAPGMTCAVCGAGARACHFPAALRKRTRTFPAWPLQAPNQHLHSPEPPGAGPVKETGSHSGNLPSGGGHRQATNEEMPKEPEKFHGIA